MGVTAVDDMLIWTTSGCSVIERAVDQNSQDQEKLVISGVRSCGTDTRAVPAAYISLVYSESSTLSGLAYEELKR